MAVSDKKKLMDIKVAVLMGGPSSERNISMKSGKAVEKALREGGFRQVVAIDADNNLDIKLKKEKVEVAFIALHGRYGEDGTVQKLLEGLGVAYTGSGMEASRKAFDKSISKKIFIEEGVSTPDFYVLEKGNPESKLLPKFPLVIKPAREGSTIGISIVGTEEEYLFALDKAFEYDDKVLVEKYVDGREVTVGILDGSVLPVVEIIPHKKFFDFEAKYTEGLTDFEVPAKLADNVYQETQSQALRAHQVLGCYGLSRVDIIIDSSGKPYVMEVNSIPGMTPLSLLPKAARAAGIDFVQLCCKLVEIALKNEAQRHKGTK